jgi:hypothetical protein
MFVALSAPMAHASTCAPLDVECIAQLGGDTLGGTLGGVVDRGKDTADGGAGTVGGVVQQARDTVGNVLNPGGSGGGSSGDSGGGSGGTRHHAGPVGSTTARSFTSTLNTIPGNHQRRDEGHGRSPSTPPSFARSAARSRRTAKQLSFPLILAVIVALFVAIQNRVDRNDPKPALAPLTPDRMRFV